MEYGSPKSFKSVIEVVASSLAAKLRDTIAGSSSRFVLWSLTIKTCCLFNIPLWYKVVYTVTILQHVVAVSLDHKESCQDE